jgi:hypothetical protein
MDTKEELNKKEFILLKECLDIISQYHEWEILVKWKEFDLGRPWKEFISYGPFNTRFFEWLDAYWDTFRDKPSDLIRLIELHRFRNPNINIGSYW